VLNCHNCVINRLDIKDGNHSEQRSLLYGVLYMGLALSDRSHVGPITKCTALAGDKLPNQLAHRNVAAPKTPIMI